MEHKIYLSPSDQRSNRYAVGNTNEAEQCRRIALAAQAALTRCGFQVKTNVSWNGDDAMDKRIAESNAWGADAHIPIHTNAFNGKVAGTRLFCYDTAGEGYRLCKAILEALSPITPGQSDSITAYGWAEVVRTHATAAYLEVGFHDNPVEAQWIIDHTDDIAEAIAIGCCKYFGSAYIPQDVPTHDPKPAEKLYRVQVGAFSVRSNAEEYRDKLQASGYPAFIVEV